MVLLSLAQEMKEVSIESGIQQPPAPTVSYVSEEYQPFLAQEQQQQQLSEEEELKQIIAIIDAQNAAQANSPVPVPAPAGYTSAMPQYPFVFPQQPQQPQQQQQFVYLPFQPTPAADQHQSYYPAPMMYPGMPLPQPYPAMMVMMPPDNKQ